MRYGLKVASIEACYYDRFFDPLVGSDHAITEFQDGLVRSGILGSSDPYDQLEQGVKAITRQVIDRDCRQETDDQMISKLWTSIEANAVFGASLTIASLQAVGSRYENEAETPQLQANVAASTTRALGQTYGMAFSGSLTGSVNVAAMNEGFNPRGLLAFPHTLLHALFSARPGGKDNFDRGFVSEVDKGGQISVSPKYKRKLGRTDGPKCPAVHSPIDKMEEEASKSPRDLWLFLKAIGDVALYEIYPSRFPIISSPDSTRT